MYCPNEECPDLSISGVVAEYRPELTVCPRCGSYLVSTSPFADRSPNPPPENRSELLLSPEPVFECAAHDEQEIESIAEKLDSLKIPFEVVEGSLSADEQSNVLFVVSASRAEQVRDLLAEFESEGKSNGPQAPR